MEDQDHLAPFQQVNDTWNGELSKDFDKVQDDWKEKVEVWRKKALEVEDTFDKIQSSVFEKVENFLEEQGAASSCFHVFVAILRMIIKAREQKKDRQPLW